MAKRNHHPVIHCIGTEQGGRSCAGARSATLGQSFLKSPTNLVSVHEQSRPDRDDHVEVLLVFVFVFAFVFVFVFVFVFAKTITFRCFSRMWSLARRTSLRSRRMSTSPTLGLTTNFHGWFLFYPQGMIWWASCTMLLLPSARMGSQLSRHYLYLINRKPHSQYRKHTESSFFILPFETGQKWNCWLWPVWNTHWNWPLGIEPCVRLQVNICFCLQILKEADVKIETYYV